jgi:diaminopimelate decarboxylase
VRLAHHLTIRNGHLHINGQDCAILDAGAYGYAMSSQYNGRPRCPEVLLKGTRVGLMRRAETVDDLTVALERPAWQV